MRKVHVGCAGWSVPRQVTARLPRDGSHLERYGQVFPAVEINSSFYRAHKRETYQRWAASVPGTFRFAVKLPRELTHTRRLRGAREPLNSFLSGVSGLGGKLGPVLVQLPPSLAFDRAVARRFLRTLRDLHDAPVVLEARHASWFEGDADALLAEYRVGRVAADPPPYPPAAEPGGWLRIAYFRLHGSPRMYYSAYGAEFVGSLAQRLSGLSKNRSVWCIFNNTAAGAAARDALALLDRLTIREE
ncbi:MAG: DUF72 domain-containing protein [Gemmatimonadales bacterium]|nr:DUF72 domain-containing protein [Gemmatimonadales bacterium]NIN11136.1 DUF72 domain-containing protein [Gemmatimonadales bacterium]NIN49735.1 DUF72 domain-containing protein [Gemmatimonadales bacterium]NIP07199.1 DUF72 domain-containing protein [Gemmatimonadales bacterium]NIR00412.1 DUF72 domain-containing protein [Gemmatimonadales bacterium]